MTRRGLDRVRSLFRPPPDGSAALAGRKLERLRDQLRECAAGLGGEVAARTRAVRLGETYLRLDDAGRHKFLRVIATEFGPDPAAVAAAHAAYQAAVGTQRQWDAEAGLRQAMRSARVRILTHLNALPQGVKFLVDLRADLLRYLEQDPELAVLDRELEVRLTSWFDVGFLELSRITWQSPAALLERVIRYEAVHEIRSWDDLRNRLDTDRRCYAFFHPRMPMEPLIFVEVALVKALADSIQHLLDVAAPVFEADRATTAIFYSISNTQQGLRGVSFGNFLLKRVIDDLKRDLPRLRTFATLSPLPQFRSWLVSNPGVLAGAASASEVRRLRAEGGVEPYDLLRLLESPGWHQKPQLARALREPVLRLAARYLFDQQEDGRPRDAVARFHLGNGARIERLNWLADTSASGLRRSFGVMVNYLYDPDDIETNVEAFVRAGRIVAAHGVERLRSTGAPRAAE